MDRLQSEMGMSIILITHDLGVIAETCDEVVVMYAGRVVERAPPAELFANPLHAYTKGLLNSIPTLDTPSKSILNTIPGMVASLADHTHGCRFCQRMGRIDRRIPRAARLRRGLARPLGGNLPGMLSRHDIRRFYQSPICASISRSAAASCCARPAPCAPWTACRSTSLQARPSASSASPAAANPPSARPSSACSSRPPAPSISKDRHHPRQPAFAAPAAPGFPDDLPGSRRVARSPHERARDHRGTARHPRPRLARRAPQAGQRTARPRRPARRPPRNATRSSFPAASASASASPARSPSSRNSSSATNPSPRSTSPSSPRSSTCSSSSSRTSASPISSSPTIYPS